MQPHSFAVPPPPQVSGAVQSPQLSVPPQPSEMVPQFFPAGHAVSGVQPQTPAVPPPPQVFGAVQVPQFTRTPQSSVNVPQLNPSVPHVSVGVQPQTFAVPPPPHVFGAVQLPQPRVKPVQSPFGMVPQSLPCAAQVVGVQQMPNSAAPCLLVGFMHDRLQQLTFVAHSLPAGLQISA